MFSYKLRNFLFAWNLDEERDLTFSVCKVIHFIKYKEGTIVKFGKKEYLPAPKYL